MVLTRAYEAYHRVFDPSVILVESYGWLMFVDKTDVGVAPSLIYNGTFDPFETLVFRSLLKPGMTVMDIGANVGYFSLIASSVVGPSGKIFAFEPQPRMFRLLKANLRINGCMNVEPIKCAITAAPGSVRLFVDGSNQGAHSLASGNLIKRGMTLDVAADSVDHFLASRNVSVDLFKIDTQGAEGLITQGARNAFSRPGTKIIMEFWPWGLRNIGSDPMALLRDLEGMGFGIRIMDEKTQSFVNLTFEELIASCDASDNGWGFYNLLLER